MSSTSAARKSFFRLGDDAPWLLALTAAMIGMLAIVARRGFWNDEILSIHYASLPLPALWEAMKRGSDGMLPGFYLLLHFWIGFAGGVDELVTRAPGILFFGLGAAVLLRTLARALSPGAAGWAAIILMFSGGVTLVDLRAYNWLLGALAMSLALVLVWDENEAPRRRLCLLNGALQLFTWSLHPFACIYASAIGAGVILAPGRGKEKALYATSYLPAALALGLWIPSLRNLAKLNEPWNWIARPGWKELAELYLCVPLVIAGIVAGGAVVLALSRRRPATAEPRRRSPRALVIGSAAMLPIPLALWLYSQGPKVIVLPRYCLPVLLSWTCLAAVIWAKAEATRALKPARGALWAATAALFLFTLFDAFNPARAKFAQNILQLEGGLQEAGVVPADAPILLESTPSFLPRDYYNLRKRSYWYVLNFAMARGGGDCREASVEANLMERMKESGQTNVLTVEEALALARAKGRVYVIDDPRHHALDPLMIALSQRGWRYRTLKQLNEPAQQVAAQLREFQAPPAGAGTGK